MSPNGSPSPSASQAIEVHKLTFAFPHSTSKLPALKDVDLVLPRGSICIMVGSNGAGAYLITSIYLRLYRITDTLHFFVLGKSTLLQILAGKRLTKSHAMVLGSDVL